MARCALDLSHPKFRQIGSAADADLQAGLAELRDKVARDHKLSGFFSHPMKRFPAHQNKVWEWDFAPRGDRSSTRKGWRLFAYLPDPRAAEPIPAIAFLSFDKKHAPKGDQAKYIADVLKDFLAQTTIAIRVETRFRRQVDSVGRTISLCLNCWEKVAISADEAEVEVLEGTHECAVSQEQPSN